MTKTTVAINLVLFLRVLCRSRNTRRNRHPVSPSSPHLPLANIPATIAYEG